MKIIRVHRVAEMSSNCYKSASAVAKDMAEGAIANWCFESAKTI